MTVRHRALATALWLGLVGGSAAQTASEPPAATAAEPSVTGAAAFERLRGNTITGKTNGQPFTEFFDAGGAVRYADKDGLSTGTWALRDSKVCVDFPDDDDRSCALFTVTGTSGTALEDDGTTTRFDILPGNSKGL